MTEVKMARRMWRKVNRRKLRKKMPPRQHHHDERTEREKNTYPYTARLINVVIAP